MQRLEQTEAVDRIRERAYAIWQSEGCPEGCAEKNWLAAEEEILYAEAAPDRNTTLVPQPDASDAELQANDAGQPDAQPAGRQRRRA